MGTWRLALAFICAAGIATAMVTASRIADAAQTTDPQMVGRWSGTAEIFVNWTRARALPVRLVIAPNDSVSGAVGDACLVRGHLQRNRGWLGRRLNIKTDYIIVADFVGPVIADEHVTRSSVMLPLNWKNHRFEGGVTTSGSKTGGAESMQLAAGRLVLERGPDMIICGSGAP